MLTVRYSTRAKQDLSAIAAYLEGEYSAKVAATAISRIRQRIRTLQRTAAGYPLRRGLGRDTRSIRIDPYLAFFRVGDSEV